MCQWVSLTLIHTRHACISMSIALRCESHLRRIKGNHEMKMSKKSPANIARYHQQPHCMKTPVTSTMLLQQHLSLHHNTTQQRSSHNLNLASHHKKIQTQNTEQTSLQWVAASPSTITPSVSSYHKHQRMRHLYLYV